MRAYMSIEGIKDACNVDCITMTNNNTEEVLNLSFCEVDCGRNKDGIYIRLRDEEIATFGLPKSLEGCFGNNHKTLSFIENSKVESIVLHPFDENVEIDLKDAVIVGLSIEAGEQGICYGKDDLENIVLEMGY